jgi:mono/diheme cytochrome c family protein
MKFAASVALIFAAAAAIIATSAMGQSAPSAPAPDQAAQAPDQAHGEDIFNTRCKDCHDPAVERAPNRDQLAAKSPAEILTALTTGPMQPMAQGLSQDDKQAVAAFLTAKH